MVRGVDSLTGLLQNLSDGFQGAKGLRPILPHGAAHPEMQAAW
jgi:hypothetical protein